MSSLPQDRQHHIQVAPGEVGRYVLLPGDPGRSEPIARLFDEPRLVARNREYETWSGYLDGELVSVTSTGIGCPSAAIAMEELVKVGADTFIRVGTSGSLQRDIRPGDLGVINAAIRDEGTSSHYLPIEFPAVADIDVTRALAVGARSAGKTVHVGVSQSKDSFYGQHEPGRMPMARRLQDRWAAWMAGGAICSEMEASALYIVAATLRVRAGGIMMIAGNPDMIAMTEEEHAAVAVENLLPAAIAGLRELIAQDRAVAS
ncbi:nucleoside phosphorylase [Microbacterium sp. 22195]|uniref:nucleoside phosphorylase n=1 Tax=Microbacterium sp. 22195 TaxID=3453891 RepID=UPI003F86BF4A